MGMSKKFFSKVKNIPGWIATEDAEIIISLLQHQAKKKQIGNVLEIGSYKGKSAILLANYINEKVGERLHLCDVFDKNDLGSENLTEISNSYDSYDLDGLRRTMQLKTNLQSIIYISENSINLAKVLVNESYRFIHIDGSHLSIVVEEDLKFAVNHLADDNSIICLDDYRAQHALGVARALWGLLETLGLSIIFAGPSKIFLRKRPLDLDTIEFVRGCLKESFLELALIEDFGQKYGVVKSRFDLTYLQGWKRAILQFLMS